MTNTSFHAPEVACTLALALGVAALGCDERRPPLPVAPPASALAPSTPPPVSPRVVELALDDATSAATIDMPAPKEHIKARAEGAAGTLWLDPDDITRSRGEVRVDLTTLSTTTFADARDATQTAHARTWLEVADGEGGKLPDDVKAANRYATYAIRGVTKASATNLADVPPEPHGADVEREVRTLALTTTGDLLVHGRAVERDAELDVVLDYGKGAPADRPRGVTVRTRKPLRVVLAEHDVKPRDVKGQLARSAFHLLGTKVADIADVTLDLRGKPRS